MSGSQMIRFRLKDDLAKLLEARGMSASKVAKQIVLDEIKRSPLPADLIPAVEATDREDAISATEVQQIRLIASSAPVSVGDEFKAREFGPDAYALEDASVGEELLDEAIDAAEKGGISIEITERPSPFAGITPRLGAEPPPKPDAPIQNSDPGDESDALRAEWRTLMKTDPGLAINIGTFEEFKRRKENA